MTLLHTASTGVQAVERPLRIVHVLDAIRLEAGGVTRAVIDMCNALARRGHGVVCMTFDDKDAPDSWRRDESDPKPGEVVCEQMTRGRSATGMLGLADRRSCLRMQRRFEKADVVHLHTPWARVNLQASKLCRASGRPYVLSVHGMLNDWSMSVRRTKKIMYLKIGGRQLLACAACVHCTASAEMEQAKKWLNSGLAQVAPCVFDSEPYRSVPDPGIMRNKRPDIFSNGGPHILFISRLHYKKRADVLLESFPAVLREWPDARLILAGPGETRYVNRLKRMARRLGIDSRTHFIGMVLWKDKLSLYRACDVTAVPTSQENFGLVFVESLACGTPVVTTPHVDIWRELEATGGAWIVEQSAQAFAGALLDILRDRAALREAGERARNAVLQWLDANRIVNQYEDMYASAMHGFRAA